MLQAFPYASKDMKKSRNKELAELFDSGGCQKQREWKLRGPGGFLSTPCIWTPAKCWGIQGDSFKYFAVGCSPHPSVLTYELASTSSPFR